LVRCIGDALAGVAFHNDAQVVDLIAMKRYAPAHLGPHVIVRVEPAAGVAPVASEQPLFTWVH
jgi:Holliday junction resolvase RusA-like endonuclease